MRVLFVGMTSIAYVRDNWLRPMQEMYEVDYISYGILYRALGIEGLNRYIVEKSKTGYDYIFFYPDGLGQMFSDELFEALKGQRTIVFHADDEPDKWYNRNARFDHRYGFIAGSSKRAYEKRKNAQGYFGNACYIPWGYSSSIYYRIKDRTKDTDVVFVGSNFERDGQYYFDGELRQRLLTAVYRACVEHGFCFKIYGGGWDRHPVLASCYAGFAPDDEINAILNRSRIILGLGYTIDKDPGFQTKLKHFEFSGTGSFQLVNDNPELKEIFGDTIGYFSDENDMTDRIIYFLEHEEEREDKASRAYDICRSECTMDSRIREVFDNAGEYFGHHPEKTQNRGRLTISVNTNVTSYEGASKCRYIIYADEKAEIIDLNDSFLTEAVGSCEEMPEVIACSSVVTFYGRNGSGGGGMVRRNAGPDAVILPPCYPTGSLLYEKEIERYINIAREDGLSYPLINFLFREDVATGLIRSCREGNTECLEKAFRVNAICSDLGIPEDDFVIERYNRFFDGIISDDKLTLVYGLGGYIFSIWSEWLQKRSCKGSIKYVDRDRAGSVVDGIECISADALMNGTVKPSVILIMSVTAGEEIAQLIKPLEEDVMIIKMYDMNVYSEGGCR